MVDVTNELRLQVGDLISSGLQSSLSKRRALEDVTVRSVSKDLAKRPTMRETSMEDVIPS